MTFDLVWDMQEAKCNSRGIGSIWNIWIPSMPYAPQ